MANRRRREKTFGFSKLCLQPESKSEDDDEDVEMRLQFLPESRTVRPSIWSTQSYGMASELASPTAFCAKNLFDAVREDELDVVIEELGRLGDKSGEINKAGKRGTTLLHLAARYNFVNITSVLLEYGASIDIPSNVGGWTALHIACR